MSSGHAAGLVPLVDAGSTAMLCCLLCQVKCPRRRGVTIFRAIFGGFNWMRKAVQKVQTHVAYGTPNLALEPSSTTKLLTRRINVGNQNLII